MSYKPLFKSCELRCPKCKNKQSINRRRCLLKKAGHIKTLWCPICKKRTKHIELADNEDFKFEE